MEAVSKINNPVIYGMGNLTSALVRAMNSGNLSPLCIIDNYKNSGCFEGIPVYNIKEVRGLDDKDISIIITPINSVSDVYKTLNEHCIKGNTIPIWEIIGDEEIADRLKYLNRL